MMEKATAAKNGEVRNWASGAVASWGRGPLNRGAASLASSFCLRLVAEVGSPQVPTPVSSRPASGRSLLENLVYFHGNRTQRAGGRERELLAGSQRDKSGAWPERKNAEGQPGSQLRAAFPQDFISPFKRNNYYGCLSFFKKKLNT